MHAQGGPTCIPLFPAPVWCSAKRRCFLPPLGFPPPFWYSSSWKECLLASLRRKMAKLLRVTARNCCFSCWEESVATLTKFHADLMWVVVLLYMPLVVSFFQKLSCDSHPKTNLTSQLIDYIHWTENTLTSHSANNECVKWTKMVSKESPINLKAADQTKPVIPNNHTFSEPKVPPPPRSTNSTNNLLLQV